MAFSIAKHGSYIYDVKISGFTRSSIYIYNISRLRVEMGRTCGTYGGGKRGAQGVGGGKEAVGETQT
jgi:hypothetical protein